MLYTPHEIDTILTGIAKSANYNGLVMQMHWYKLLESVIKRYGFRWEYFV